MDLLVLDGYTFKVPLIEYEISPQILDGEGTSRTAAVGWDIVRDPNGTLVNLSVTVGIEFNQNPDFIALYNKIMALGKVEFISVQLKLPVGILLTQDMYCNPKAIKMLRITKDGIAYWGNWKLDFIAKSAYIT